MVPSRILFRCCLCALIALFGQVTAPLYAQSERGTITGTIRDNSGGSIPGVAVKITNTATNQSVDVTTSDTGDFTAVQLNVGTYNVHAEKSGFRPAEIKGLTLNAASSVHADLKLEVGQSQQVVEVQASAVQINSDDAKTSVTINQKLVDTLPLVVGGAVRSPFDLAALTPESKNVGGDAGFSLGGGQGASYGATSRTSCARPSPGSTSRSSSSAGAPPKISRPRSIASSATRPASTP